jgi:hypothetical protein
MGNVDKAWDADAIVEIFKDDGHHPTFADIPATASVRNRLVFIRVLYLSLSYLDIPLSA